MVARPPLTRRGLLGLAGLGVAAGVVGCGTRATSEEPDGPTPRRIRYDTRHRDQYGVLRTTVAAPLGLVVLVHGGFWSDSFGLRLMDPVARDLRRRGYVTWNVEYPRLGRPGFTPTLLVRSILAAFDKVPALGLPKGVPTYSIGHSAGGQLALLAASGRRRSDASRFVPGTTVSLSGVLDLRRGIAQGVGGGAIEQLTGHPGPGAARHVAGLDPRQQVPAAGKVIAVHAEDDEIVPLDQSRSYVQADAAAGGAAELVLVPGGHFDLIDPSSEAWARAVRLLAPAHR